MLFRSFQDDSYVCMTSGIRKIERHKSEISASISIKRSCHVRIPEVCPHVDINVVWNLLEQIAERGGKGRHGRGHCYLHFHSALTHVLV